MRPSLVIFLHSHRYDRLFQACNMLLTASSMGWTCHLFLFHGALASFIAGTWDDMNVSPVLGPSAERPEWLPQLERGFEEANMPSLYASVEKAREETPGLKVFACSTSCKVLALPVAEVRARVDEVVGLHTMMQITAQADHVIYI